MNNKKTILTEQFGYATAVDMKQLLTSRSNSFIGIGRSINSGVSNIENAIYTTVYRNQVYRNLEALKQIQPADIQLVIPRVDWSVNNKYDAYDDMVELFAYYDYKQLGKVNANANTKIGAVKVAAGKGFRFGGSKVARTEAAFA